MSLRVKPTYPLPHPASPCSCEWWSDESGAMVSWSLCAWHEDRAQWAARPAVASEGLRAALERLVEKGEALDAFATWSALNRPEVEPFRAELKQARAALASDAGRSVGALDTLDTSRGERAMRQALQEHDREWNGEPHKCRHSTDLLMRFAAAYDAERQGESDAS